MSHYLWGVVGIDPERYDEHPDWDPDGERAFGLGPECDEFGYAEHEPCDCCWMGTGRTATEIDAEAELLAKEWARGVEL